MIGGFIVVITGLIVVLLLVLVVPFVNKTVEENLEPFLFVMGVAASIISGIMSFELVLKAFEEPVMIASAVFIAGALFFLLSKQFQTFINNVLKKMPVTIFVFLVVVILGLLSSVITAIIASIILVEITYLLPLTRKQKIVVCIIACFSIGLGATLTPIGEPLATIAISKLDQSFFYLFGLLGKYIIPAVIAFGIVGAIYVGRTSKSAANEVLSDNSADEVVMEADTWKSIIIRALKVYLFVMALVFLGEGFQPLIDKYVLGLSPQLLYWVNMISAILDNATLTAAEISRQMTDVQVTAIIMGLLISGGMLIPGNIPNIISASKLKISSKEWAIWGVPLGLLTMIIYFVILFYV
jgi:predicted cation transporter